MMNNECEWVGWLYYFNLYIYFAFVKIHFFIWLPTNGRGPTVWNMQPKGISYQTQLPFLGSFSVARNELRSLFVGKELFSPTLELGSAPVTSCWALLPRRAAEFCCHDEQLNSVATTSSWTLLPRRAASRTLSPISWCSIMSVEHDELYHDDDVSTAAMTMMRAQLPWRWGEICCLADETSCVAMTLIRALLQWRWDELCWHDDDASSVFMTMRRALLPRRAADPLLLWRTDNPCCHDDQPSRADPQARC